MGPRSRSPLKQGPQASAANSTSSAPSRGRPSEGPQSFRSLSDSTSPHSRRSPRFSRPKVGYRPRPIVPCAGSMVSHAEVAVMNRTGHSLPEGVRCLVEG